GREADEVADVAGAPAFALDVGERLEQPPDWVVAAEARGLDARAAVEAADFDPRVLADHPDVELAHHPAEARLRAGVLVVGRPVLGRIRVRVEHLDRPAGHERRELARLVRVLRGEVRYTVPHCTPFTSGSADRWAASWVL